MEKLSVNLPAEAYRHVEQRAWATFTDMSEYIRRLVFEDMERHSEPTGPRAA
jgi:Arc/MetJ-type ribon-helix-helix transcriptional regulator